LTRLEALQHVEHRCPALGVGQRQERIHGQDRADQPAGAQPAFQFGRGHAHVGQRQRRQAGESGRVRPHQRHRGFVEQAGQRQRLRQRQAVDAEQAGKQQHLVGYARGLQQGQPGRNAVTGGVERQAAVEVAQMAAGAVHFDAWRFALVAGLALAVLLVITAPGGFVPHLACMARWAVS
jgi:hypothetical protein